MDCFGAADATERRWGSSASVAFAGIGTKRKSEFRRMAAPNAGRFGALLVSGRSIPEGAIVSEEDYIRSGRFGAKTYVSGCECRDIDKQQEAVESHEEILRAFFRELTARRVAEVNRLAATGE